MLFSSELNQDAQEATQKDQHGNNIIKKGDDWYYNDKQYVTNSHLKVLIEDGPQGLEYYLENGSEDNPAFAFGRALHTLILEPDEFLNRYYIFDDRAICKEIGGARPTSTKKYKEWKEELSQDNFGKEMISLSDMDKLTEMEDKLYSIPQVKALLDKTAREIIYQRDIDGVPCKGKLDAVKPNKMIIDLKTTSDAPTPYNMMRRIRNFNYDRQMAFYCELAQVPDACIIAIEKKKPYTVGVYMLSEDTLAEGAKKYQTALTMYKELYQGNLDLDKFYYSGSL
jgi:hypothetical protein